MLITISRGCDSRKLLTSRNPAVGILATLSCGDGHQCSHPSYKWRHNPRWLRARGGRALSSRIGRRRRVRQGRSSRLGEASHQSVVGRDGGVDDLPEWVGVVCLVKASYLQRVRAPDGLILPFNVRAGSWDSWLRWLPRRGQPVNQSES